MYMVSSRDSGKRFLDLSNLTVKCVILFCTKHDFFAREYLCTIYCVNFKRLNRSGGTMINYNTL